MFRFFSFYFILSFFAFGETLVLDLREFEKEVLKRNPILKEKELEIKKSQLVKSRITANFWAKDFRLRLLGGSIPSLKVIHDSSFIYSNGLKTQSYLLRSETLIDFHRWGIYYGFDIDFVQPLNFFRYNKGLDAASKNIKVKLAEFKKEKNKVSVQVQEIYYGLLLAKKLLEEVNEATKRLDKAQEQLEEDLDEEKENVSQDDLLEIIASRYRLDKSTNEVERSYNYALNAARIALNLQKRDSLMLKDKNLKKTTLKISSYEKLKKKLLKSHPDLRQLKQGLSARRDLVNIAKGEQFFDFFIFAKATVIRTFGGGNDVDNDSPFASNKNPFNKTTGAFGIGAQVDLGFWRSREKMRRETVELQQLERREVYAEEGLYFILNEAYLKYQEAKKNLKSAKKSFKARQSLLKSAGFNTTLEDVDISKLVGPYTQNLEAKRDYYQAIFNYNISIAILVREIGLSLSDIQDKV